MLLPHVVKLAGGFSTAADAEAVLAFFAEHPTKVVVDSLPEPKPDPVLNPIDTRTLPEPEPEPEPLPELYPNPKPNHTHPHPH